MASVYVKRPFDELTAADWDATLDVDLRAAFLCAHAAVPHMRAAGRRPHRQLQRLAGAAAAGRATEGYLPYYVAKAGVIALTEALALELAADNILVNAIAPGPILAPPGHGDEEMRSGRAGDAARAVGRRDRDRERRPRAARQRLHHRRDDPRRRRTPREIIRRVLIATLFALGGLAGASLSRPAAGARPRQGDDRAGHRDVTHRRRHGGGARRACHVAGRRQTDRARRRGLGAHPHARRPRRRVARGGASRPGDSDGYRGHPRPGRVQAGHAVRPRPGDADRRVVVRSTRASGGHQHRFAHISGDTRRSSSESASGRRSRSRSARARRRLAR